VYFFTPDGSAIPTHGNEPETEPELHVLTTTALDQRPVLVQKEDPLRSARDGTPAYRPYAAAPSDGTPLRTMRTFDPLPRDIQEQAPMGPPLERPGMGPPPSGTDVPKMIPYIDITDDYERSIRNIRNRPLPPASIPCGPYA
jgi:hypothetical protein